MYKIKTDTHRPLCFKKLMIVILITISLEKGGNLLGGKNSGLGDARYYLYLQSRMKSNDVIISQELFTYNQFHFEN